MAYKYVFSGTLPLDAPSYVKRQADDELYQGLKKGDFCYVLNSRQTGKSSLRVQVMHRLKQNGFSCAAIDVSMDGTQRITQEQWYASITRRLVQDFELDVNLRSWWREYDMFPPLVRLREFIEGILLAQVSQNIVIFIDEIDSVLSLNFSTDDFFAFIRGCYNQRVDKPAYKRLTFVLLGVATPSDLIRDKKRTPFNIGRAIQLHGFELQEAKPLIKGLEGKVSNPQNVLHEILNWTGGQPFLTQKLCQLVCNCSYRLTDGDEAQWVKQLVGQHLIENWQAQDEPEHLRTIRDRILSNEQRAGRLLALYQQILQQGKITADGSSEQMELGLSGLVVRRQGELQVKNRIYESVFHKNWVVQALDNLRPYSQEINAWIATHGQDNSQLLRGEKLRDALAWALNKSLSDQDYQFLSASQELEKQKAQNALSKIKNYLEARRQGTLNPALAIKTQETVYEFLEHLSLDNFREIVFDLEVGFDVVNQTLLMMDSVPKNQKFDAILHEMLRSLTLKTGEVIGADRTTIYLLDEDKNELWSLSAEGYNNSTLEIRIPVGQGIAGEVAQTKEVINIHYDFYDDPRSTASKKLDNKTGYRTYTMLVLPLVDELGNLVAVAQLLNKLKQPLISRNPLYERIDKQGFTSDDENIFRQFARSIQMILKSSQLFYKAAQKQNAASALMKATHSLNQSSLDLDQTLKKVMEQAKELMNADRSTLWLLDETGNNLKAKIPKPNGSIKEEFIPIGVGFAGQVAASHEPLIIPFDLYHDPRSKISQEFDQRNGYRTCSLLCMPVFNADKKLIAVTQLVNKKKQGDFPGYNPADWPQAPDCWKASFDRRDLELMEAFNIQAGVALQNAKLFYEVKQHQQEQRDLIRNISSGVIFTDKLGFITRANDKAKSLLGLRDIVGKSLHHLLRLQNCEFAELLDAVLTATDDKNYEKLYVSQTLLSNTSVDVYLVDLRIISVPDSRDATQVSATIVMLDDSNNPQGKEAQNSWDKAFELDFTSEV
ncbi:AAA-like domain-containing protein [Coleofasciculus sp. E2-BRE-01]|uniref:AAA-like domain-containing protein n=1 Tax=Coleofasciculus sp. E2-BRE-01 TaxID=3069524 RepID=UPI0032F9AC1A